MIKKHFTGMERRAENTIWNAAGRYDFDPPFMAFFENGRPDLYFNMIIGLAFKWLDVEKLDVFFSSYASYHRAEEADELLWIGLENCLYEKEYPQRPVMERLRRQRAQLFYKMRETLSRQQMMLASMLIYDQHEARWAEVLGRKGGLLSPREEGLREALRFPGSLDTDEVIERMKEIMKRFLHYAPSQANASRKTGRENGLGKRARRLLHRENRYRDTLMVRTGSLEGDIEGSAQLTHAAGSLKSVQEYERDLSYIRQSLGESMLPEADLRRLENDLCTGAHSLCRLWVTDGRKQESAGGAAQLTGRDAADLGRVRRDSDAQGARNRKWLKEHALFMASEQRRLSARIDEVLSGYEHALPEESKAGVLRPDIAYRLPVLRDPDVFLRAGDEMERSVTVDLLLDASASRLNYQEQLAAQATMIAKSCMAAKIPVQVECFRSLRGFTVLNILKERGSRDCSRICDYFAGGWNRDGLGLRLASEFLPRPNEAAVRILLTLTDASPNDSTRMVSTDGSHLTREYQGRGAVLDAKDAVAQLRADGVIVAAIFLGPTLYMENLHTIYGKDCVRIHRIEQLEEAVATLLDQVMRENQGTFENRVRQRIRDGS